MRLGKDLENKPIISVSDGRILGRSKDLYVDAGLTALAGLYVGSEGVIRRRALVIPRADIVLFGIDVILVKNADVVTSDKDLAEAKQWQRLHDLQGREIRTPGGTKLATVGDVILDEEGALAGFALARTFVEGPLAEQGTVPRAAVVSADQGNGVIAVDLALLEGIAAGEEVPLPVQAGTAASTTTEPLTIELEDELADAATGTSGGDEAPEQAGSADEAGQGDSAAPDNGESRVEAAETKEDH